jgi:hypothetical protein
LGAALLLAAALLAGGPAAAQVVSDHPDQVAVVLYQDHAPTVDEVLSGRRAYDPGLAAITETRTIDLPAGRSRISFRGVADAIIPQTAALEGLPGRLVERNYDFDLLSPAALLDKAIDQPATLVRTDPRTGRASETAVTVRSGPSGVVLQTADGRAEALGCSGLPERLVFDHAPPGLTATPTLSVTVEPPAAGRYVVKLSYLATGLRWSADYVARVRPGGRQLDLLGWLTLANDGATTFGNAPTQVVAGRLARVPAADAAPLRRPQGRFGPACWSAFAVSAISEASFAAPMAPGAVTVYATRQTAVRDQTPLRKAIVGDLGDYKLYTLPEPTTVAARQTKQAAFLEKTAVPFDRVYVFTIDGADQIQAAETVLRLQNTATAGLGAALPGGAVAVFEPSSGSGAEPRLLLTAQDAVKDTPVGLPLEIDLGQAPDVTMASRPVEVQTFRLNGAERHRTTLELTVRNAGRTPAAVELKQRLQGLRITAESRPHQVKDAFALWPATVAAGGEQTLRFTVEDTD